MASTNEESSLKDCDNTRDYQDTGWIIHNPKYFDKIFKKHTKIIDSSLRDGSMVNDLSGTIRTYNTLGSRPLMMKVNTYDSLDTDRDLMYGDFAVMVKHFSPEQPLEARWFDGKRKHVVINPKYMSCISTIPPFAENTIF